MGTNTTQESRYARSLIEASLDPLVTINAAGKITDVNEASIKVTGVSRGKLIGTDFSNYFTEPKKAKDGYLQVFEKSFVSDYPLTIKHKNGNLTDVLYNASVYKDEKGNVLGVFAAARDVTEQKWAIELRAANRELAFQNEEKEKRAEELIVANNELLFQNNEKEKRAAELVIANKELAFQNNEKEKRAAELDIANKELAFQNSVKEKRASELVIANKELAFQNDEKEKRAAELVIANEELAFQNKEKEKRAAELDIANKELAFQNSVKEKRASELVIANKELAFQNDEKEKRAAELVIANEELAFQNKEKEKRAAELDIANKELAFQNSVKEKRASELVIANKELAFQNDEKEKRAAELAIANKELAFQNNEKEKRAAELAIANKELAFQNLVKEKRASELVIANKELAFQNDEKEKRAAELAIANKELAFQNDEKEKRAAELGVANKELAFQNDEKEKRAEELGVANKELAFQNDEKEKRAAELSIANKELAFQNDEKEKRAAELSVANKELAFQNNEKEKRAEELGVANKELAFQNDEKEKRAEELGVANKELAFQNNEKEKRAAELIIANKELLFQNKEKEKRAAELSIANQELNQSEELLQNSLKEVSDYKEALDETTIIALTDQKGIIKKANGNFCKISKYAENELIGKDHRIINSGYHSKDFMHNLWETISNGKIWKGELKNKAKDGTFYWVDTTIVPFLNEQGKPFQYLAIRVDITKRKESEDQLKKVNKELEFQNQEKDKQAAELVIANRELAFQNLEKEKLAAKLINANYARGLIEASRDPLFTISPQGKITDANNATVKITGVSSDNLKNTDFFDYFTEPQKARAVYQEVFAKGFVADYPLTIRDHKLTDVLINGSVYKDDKGTVLGVVVVARDITDQKRIATELMEAKVFAELATGIAEEAKSKAEEATRIAEDAVKAKQQFLSNMSHEIRTPMNAIIGFTKVVLKTELSLKQKEYLSAIKMSGDALIVLINDILDLAKVDAGKMSFEQTPFKLSSSISAMLHLFETKIQEKNLELIKEYDARIPEVLVGDPVRLHQIILNLVSNAVKFTTNGNIIVSVLLLNEDEKKVTIQFSVKDTGIGIPENKIDKIFENFQQASSGTSRLYGGTGLGLAIVKQLVEPQGGSINVTSKINEGSTFSFILSFLKTTADAELETGIMELDTEIKNIKVLVVEDIALNQLLMKTLLDDFGFERDIAANGKIAIEKLQSKSYDIILMDLQMPEMNGFEATEYIRKTMNSKIPIIALTADVTTVDLIKCKAVGMNDYIAKPVDERLLYSKIAGLVKKPIKINSLVLENENISSKKLKCINLDYLNHRTKSNPELMMEMISLYLEQTPPLISAMKESFQDKDWKLLQSSVHKMIPSFSIMGINKEFENTAKKIQEFASTQQETDGMFELILHLEKVCGQACLELEEEFNLIKNRKQ